MTLSIRFLKWSPVPIVFALACAAGPLAAEQTPPCQKTAATIAPRSWLHGVAPHCSKAGCFADVVGSRSEADASLAQSQVLDRTYALTLCLNAAQPNAAPDPRARVEPVDALSDPQNRR